MHERLPANKKRGYTPKKEYTKKPNDSAQTRNVPGQRARPKKKRGGGFNEKRGKKKKAGRLEKLEMLESAEAEKKRRRGKREGEYGRTSPYGQNPGRTRQPDPISRDKKMYKR